MNKEIIIRRYTKGKKRFYIEQYLFVLIFNIFYWIAMIIMNQKELNLTRILIDFSVSLGVLLIVFSILNPIIWRNTEKKFHSLK